MAFELILPFFPETIQALIEFGADVHAKSAKGETALDFARWRGQTALVELLKKQGVKVTQL